MTQEEKELLLRDICARLPYGVKFQAEDSNVYTLDAANYFALQVEDVVFKPYLRPMSSMTIEEQREVNNLLGYRKTINGFGDIRCAGWNGDTFVNISIIDKYINWLNEHHFDFRKLIEKGLALEAKEGMYKTE